MRPTVKPRPVSEADLQFSGFRPGEGAPGWKVGLASFLILGALLIFLGRKLNFTTESMTVIFFGVLTLSLLLALVTDFRAEQDKLRKWRHGELAKKLQQAEKAAREVTHRVQTIEAEAETLASDLPRLIGRVENDLEKAEEELGDRVFSPFWERIASAAEALAQYNQNTVRLATLGKNYHLLLDGETHSFPQRLNVAQLAPHPGECVEKLRTLVRAGQRDFEFAVIWEHHRTRRVLVEGFSTLESTLRDVGGSLAIAINDAAAEITGLFERSTKDVSQAVEVARDELTEGLKKIEDELKA